jgi:hypothetical protein
VHAADGQAGRADCERPQGGASTHQAQTHVPLLTPSPLPRLWNC